MRELNPQTQKSWQLIEKLVLQNNRLQQKQHRWSIFFRLLFALYLGVLLWLAWPSGAKHVGATGEEIAMVTIEGVIANDYEANANTIVAGIDQAFKSDSNIVLLAINSPGGSPVQAGQVYREIQYLKAQHEDKKVIAVIKDVGASGAYYIAAAADEIYADPASIVGSIGVIMEGFGLEGTLEKLGAERRVLTAGENKAILDPFQPLDTKQEAFVHTLLDDIHQQFIDAVKEGRGDRLQDAEHPEVFSGLFWTGNKALELGLIDGLGSVGSVARELTGDKNIVDYTQSPDRFEEIFRKFGMSLGKSMVQGVRADVAQSAIR